MDGFATSLAERLMCAQPDYWLHLDAASPLEKYPAKQHARRVQERLGVSKGLIYLPGTPSRNLEDSDMPAPFRQRRYFYYISGCNEPGCHLTYDARKDCLTLFIPRITDPVRVIWNGRGSTPEEAMDKYDIDQVRYVDELPQFISEWTMRYQGNIYALHPSQTPPVASIPRDRTDAKSLLPAMYAVRQIKDDHEISLIKQANDISSRAHSEVLANIAKFKNEAQVEGLFRNVCTSHLAKEQAYDIIAASGPNAGTLHYDANNEDFGDRQLMCLDAGCEWQLYASDITRTFPLSGHWPSEESKQIYRLVERMQDTCIGRMKPGVRYLDLHILAHQIAIDGLLSLGILHNGTKEEIYKAGTSRAFFPHGLGHHVGLEVHDVGQSELMSFSSGKYNKIPSLYPENFHLPVYDSQMCMSPADPQSPHLEESMVVTVEPGIYFSEYALNTFYLPSPIHSKYINKSVLQRYLPVGGVRIEDDILITSKGHENLTTAPKGEAMLEIIRSQNPSSQFISDSGDLGPTRRDSRSKLEAAREDGEPLRRAPGISRHAVGPVVRPIERASTLPVEKKSRKSVDFEPFDGPSLFSNFKRASTIDTAGNISTTAKCVSYPRIGPSAKSRTPACGTENPSFEHAYMEFTGQTYNPEIRSGVERKPICPKCNILFHTIERLRKSFAETNYPSTAKTVGIEPHILASEAALPKLSPKKKSRGRQMRDEYTDNTPAPTLLNSQNATSRETHVKVNESIDPANLHARLARLELQLGTSQRILEQQSAPIPRKEKNLETVDSRRHHQSTFGSIVPKTKVLPGTKPLSMGPMKMSGKATEPKAITDLRGLVDSPIGFTDHDVQLYQPSASELPTRPVSFDCPPTFPRNGSVPCGPFQPVEDYPANHNLARVVYGKNTTSNGLSNPRPNLSSRRDTQGAPRAPVSRMSMPALRTQPSRNPWNLVNQRTTPPVQNPFQSHTTNQNSHKSEASKTTSDTSICSACRENNRLCDRSTISSSLMCSYCIRHGLHCDRSSPGPSTRMSGRRSLPVSDLVNPTSSFDVHNLGHGTRITPKNDRLGSTEIHLESFQSATDKNLNLRQNAEQGYPWDRRTRMGREEGQEQWAGRSSISAGSQQRRRE